MIFDTNNVVYILEYPEGVNRPLSGEWFRVGESSLPHHVKVDGVDFPSDGMVNGSTGLVLATANNFKALELLHSNVTWVEYNVHTVVTLPSIELPQAATEPPTKGTGYYYISLNSESGVTRTRWLDRKVDHTRLNSGTVYLDKGSCMTATLRLRKAFRDSMYKVM